MEPIDNNQFEVVPTQKRKIAAPCPNVYLNPALDLLANEDPMCNTAMEIVPNKKRKRSKSCDVIAFENSALDTGISKAAVNEFLVKELENVRKNVRYCSEPVTVGIEGNVNLFDPKTEIYVPKINTSEPKIHLSEPILEELDVDITFSDNCSEIPKYSSNNVAAEGRSEHIYANLTDFVPENKVSGADLLETYVMETLEPSTSDAFTVPQTIEDNNESILQEDTNEDKCMTENCLNVSDINNITDSGLISDIEQKTSISQNLENNDISSINHTTVHTNIRNQIFVNNNSNSNLSFIDRLALDSPNLSNQSLFLDDDLNESNIMEIKTITIITKKKRIPSMKKNTNPFLDPNLKNLYDIPPPGENPFLNLNGTKNETNAELEYNDEMVNRPIQIPAPPTNPLIPRRLFDTNTTISTVNESVVQNEYENIDNLRPESPIYENVGDMTDNFNKQSKILGHDVSHFSAIDIMNLNRNSHANISNDSTETKKVKHQFFKSLKPKKVFKKFKKTFKGDKNNSVQHNVTLNPYEIPRKLPKERSLCNEESGFENPALNLDTSDIEIEEIEDFDDDEEHQYETIKTLRNTRLNMNVTPLRERNDENMDSSQNKTNTPGKKVRFDSTLNQEKLITGNSFDYGLQSPGFDAKIEKYHDELENCINEKKFLQQNM